MKKENILFRCTKMVGVALITLCSIACLSVNGSAAEKPMSAAEFSAAAAAMTGKYNMRFSLQEASQENEELAGYESARLIVKADVAPEDEAAIEIVGGYRDLYLLQYASPEEARSAERRFSEMDGVIYAEADAVLTPQFEADGTDSYQYLSSGAGMIGAKRFNAYLLNQYGNVENMPEVRILVIDSGVEADHPFLADRLLRAEGTTTLAHGTHVCGIIADLTLPNVKLISLGNPGAESVCCAKMLEYAEEGLLAINMSFSLGAEGRTFRETVETLYDEYGILCICAAGNSHRSVCSADFPANIEKAVTVSNYSGSGLESSSNYGPEIDFTAPGTNIMSAVADGQYGTMTGTSMAAPHVAAVAAMLYTAEYSRETGEGPRGEELLSLLAENADDIGAPGKDSYYGYGLVGFGTYRPYFLSASDYEGSCGEQLRWQLDDTGTMYIWGSGAIPNYSAYTAPWNDIRTEITALKIGDGITGIGNNSFLGCTNLRSVTVPPSINSFGQDPFSGCSALCEIHISALDAWCAVKMNGGTCFTAPWDLYIDDVKCSELVIPGEISAIGSYVFENCRSISELVLSEGVTETGSEAFQHCENLRKVSVPRSMKQFGAYSFKGDTELKEIHITDLPSWIDIREGGIGASRPNQIGGAIYLNGEKITELVIPDGVETIGSGAFYGCDLTSLSVPESVSEIGERAFSYCSQLGTITLPDSLETIGADAFNHTMYYSDYTHWSNGVLYIGSYLIKAENTVTSASVRAGTLLIADEAFYYCQELTSAVLPDTVRGIGAAAFSNDTKLTSVSLGKGLRRVGEGAFAECKALTQIDIPDSVTEIGGRAFYNCVGLTKLFIPNGATKVEDEAYSGCTGLTEAIIPDTVMEIGANAFYSCKNLTVLTLGAKVERIGNKAFQGCDKIESVSFPDSLREIGNYAFSNCAGLRQLRFGSGLRRIGMYAFEACGAITSVLIPENELSIDYRAFSKCSALGEFRLGDGAVSIGEGVFQGCALLDRISVPESVIFVGQKAFDGTAYFKTEENWDGDALYLGRILLRVKSTASGAFAVRSGTVCIASNAFCGFETKTVSTGSGFSISTVAVPCESVSAVSLPDGLRGIGEYAFYGCVGLTGRLTIPDSVERLDYCAFYGCSGISELSLGSGVRTVSASAFGSCTGIQTIFFNGTEAEWSEVDIDWGNEALAKDKIEFIPIGSISTFIDGNMLTVELSSLKNGKLLYALYEKDSGKMLMLRSLPLNIGQNTVKIEAESYVRGECAVKVFFLNEGWRGLVPPLCLKPSDNVLSPEL